MMAKFDPTKPVRTRDGRPARIICTDAKGIYPIVALVPDNCDEDAHSFTADGTFYEAGDSHLDLINTPERYVRWVNCYPNYNLDIDTFPSSLILSSYGYKTREEADRHATPGRIACIRIEFEEGEGLN